MSAGAKETSWLIKLIDKVTAPLKAVDKVANATSGNLDRVTNSGGRMSSMFSTLGRTITSIGLGVSLMTLTQESLAFEKGMALVNTVAKQTPEQLAVMSDQVRDISKQVPLMREQFTTGLNDIVQAGVPAANAIQFLHDSSRAAVGGQADLGEVVKTTVSIIKSYGLEWNKQLDIQNQMQKAVDIGMMSMQEFASALPKVTTLGSSLGVKLEELNGAFAAMSGVTGNAAEVSTQLSSIMAGMISPTTQAQAAAKKLGIQFDALSVKRAGGLAPFLNDLMPRIDALAKVSGQTKEGIIAELFGRKEAVIGVLALTGQLQGAWDEATGAMKDSAGAVDYAFNTMNQTVDAKMQRMRNTIFAWWDAIYNKAVPILSGIVAAIAMVFDWLAKFPEQHPYITATIAVLALLEIGVWAFTASTGMARTAWASFMLSLNTSSIMKAIGLIVTLGAGVLGLQAPFWAATSSTWALNAALWANPIVWIVGLIAAVIAAIVLMIKYWDDVKAWFVGFGKWMWDHMPFKWLIELVQQWIPTLKAAWDWLWQGMKAAMQPVADFFNWIWNKIKGFIEMIKAVANKIGSWLGLPENLDFRGYGESTEAAVASTDNSVAAVTADPVSGLSNSMGNQQGATITPPSGGSGKSSSLEMSGSSKGGNIINFKNIFDIKINGASGNPRELAEQIMREINDQLSDAVVIATN